MFHMISKCSTEITGFNSANEVKIVCRFGGVLDESISVGLLRLNLKELLVSIEAEDSIGEDDARRPPVN
jgi:hypothetical protein